MAMATKNILVYGDSLTWGIVPDTRKRLAFDERWPGVLENKLNAGGERRVRVIEDCLNGRRTVWDDPYKAGRNGRDGLAQKMEMHAPLDLVILVLGTNDFQFCHPFNTAWSSAQGVAALVKEMRGAPIEPGMPVAPVLIVSPPAAKEPKGVIAPKFAGAEKRGAGLAEALRGVAGELECGFFDAGKVTGVSAVDGVHLDAEGQIRLGEGLVKVVEGMILRAE
jgi:lysophospholipase L1-like esterase